MSRHRRILSKPFKRSRTTIYAVAGTAATASLAATLVAAGPALFTPSDGSAGQGPADMALASGREVAPATGKQQTADPSSASGYQQNPALRARAAFAESYAAVVQARRRVAAARRAAAEAARQAAEQRRRAAQQRQAAARQSAPSGAPQQIAMAMLGDFGWSSSEFSCLNSLWERESGWNPYASNPYSGAYGIPQALPGSKMASAGPDWQSNPATQIRWGLGYIQSIYGSPCGAWAHAQSAGWY